MVITTKRNNLLTIRSPSPLTLHCVSGPESQTIVSSYLFWIVRMHLNIVWKYNIPNRCTLFCWFLFFSVLKQQFKCMKRVCNSKLSFLSDFSWYIVLNISKVCKRSVIESAKPAWTIGLIERMLLECMYL